MLSILDSIHRTCNLINLFCMFCIWEKPDSPGFRMSVCGSPVLHLSPWTDIVMRTEFLEATLCYFLVETCNLCTICQGNQIRRGRNNVSEGQHCSQYSRRQEIENWVRISAEVTDWLGVSGHSLTLSEFLFSSWLKLEVWLKWALV